MTLGKTAAKLPLMCESVASDFESRAKKPKFRALPLVIIMVMVVELIAPLFDPSGQLWSHFNENRPLRFSLRLFFRRPFFQDRKRLHIVALPHKGNLEQPRFDSLDQPEIAHDPRKEVVGRIPRALQVIRRGGKIATLLKLVAAGYFDQVGEPDRRTEGFRRDRR